MVHGLCEEHKDIITVCGNGMYLVKKYRQRFIVVTKGISYIVALMLKVDVDALLQMKDTICNITLVSKNFIARTRSNLIG